MTTGNGAVGPNVVRRLPLDGQVASSASAPATSIPGLTGCSVSEVSVVALSGRTRLLLFRCWGWASVLALARRGARARTAVAAELMYM